MAGRPLRSDLTGLARLTGRTGRSRRPGDSRLAGRALGALGALRAGRADDERRVAGDVGEALLDGCQA
ncbi:hypothetical protein [Streptomyces sp. NPDC004330]|uniref:hypothetical protein n=1 Tax=Streptomyces sp. NPDC004330 TaxID=3364700 RepID=UPI003688CD9E